MPADTLVLCAYGCFLISLGRSPINSVFGFCRKLLVHAIPELGLPGELKCFQVCCMQSKNTFNFCRTFFLKEKVRLVQCSFYRRYFERNKGNGDISRKTRELTALNAGLHYYVGYVVAADGNGNFISNAS